MNLLSFDVGIKNISFCHFKGDEIIDWGILDISCPEKYVCHCGKPAKFSTPELFCNKHKPQGIILEKEIKMLKPKDFKILNEKYESKTKNEWLTFLETAVILHPLKINASKINLVEVSRNIQKQFDSKWQNTLFDIVIIENQIGPLAVRMKTVQGMITQYFIKNVPEICFVNSCNKVKGKLTYKERKNEGISQCREIIKSHEKWSIFFENNKKKDDLADCMLQGLWFIKNKL
jgi:hypothetical protein